MRATIKNYLEAEKARREEEGRDGGFSLIELIIVVVILGILVAIAIPIFANLQDQARLNAVKAVAASAATQWAAGLAQNPKVVQAYVTNDSTITVGGQPATTAEVEDVCATASSSQITTGLGSAANPVKSGPGCVAPTP